MGYERCYASQKFGSPNPIADVRRQRNYKDHVLSPQQKDVEQPVFG